MSTVSTQSTYIPKDLLTMPNGDFYELLDGQLVERKVSVLSSLVAGLIYRLLSNHCFAEGLGWVFPEGTSFQCFSGFPNRVRRSDTSFVAMDRLTAEQVSAEGHCSVVPDLAVEVLSPNDTAYEVDEKLQQWLDAGVRCVWVVNTQQRTVAIHHAQGIRAILRENDELTGEDIVPGFRCRVGDFFKAPAKKNAGE
jgi:Uma2 family endonuclease